MEDDPNRIRELRVARDWSQQRLADLAGCSKIMISELERGKRTLTVDWMRRLARAFSMTGRPVTPGELLSLDDNPLIPQGEERALLDRYRHGSADERQSLARVADALITYKPPEQEEAA
jgi:transcriptional regulator with XRE-family HTH domain